MAEKSINCSLQKGSFTLTENERNYERNYVAFAFTPILTNPNNQVLRITSICCDQTTFLSHTCVPFC